MFRVGDLAVHRLDVARQRPVEAVEYFSGSQVNAVNAALHRLQAGNTTLFIGCSCTLVELRGTCILIDPAGAGDQPAASLRCALAAIGRTVDDIDVVVCTHMHEDRVAALAERENGKLAPAFPRARHVIHEAELAFVKASWVSNSDEQYGLLYERTIRPVEQAGILETVTGGRPVFNVAGATIALEDAPGHTPGHLVVRLTSGGEQALYASDVFHHPIQAMCPSIGTPRGDANPILAAATRRTVAESARVGRVILIGPHFPDIGAGQLVGPAGAVMFEPIVEHLVGSVGQ